ncbi:Alpha/Beta hydrolase protein, partial [Leptodontidium sp. MPI-SDFR-AT-0119]
LDIVAIHGLNGDARRSWTKGDGPLWLQENLPRSLPGARVYTYSYNSKVWSSSRGDVRDWAKTLLVCLSSQRKTEKHRGRGIVFICHSLGGIVCKRALIEANEDHSFSNILESTKAIIFFGTPHVGSEQADFASMLALIAESLGTATLADRISGQRIRRDLVELLRNQSKALEDISMSFRNRLQGIEIVSFYEQDTIRGMRQLIVPRNSALMNCTGEHQIPSPGKDHSTMCQLDQYDNEYNVIIDMCEKHQSAIMTEPGT